MYSCRLDILKDRTDISEFRGFPMETPINMTGHVPVNMGVSKKKVPLNHPGKPSGIAHGNPYRTGMGP